MICKYKTCLVVAALLLLENLISPLGLAHGLALSTGLEGCCPGTAHHAAPTLTALYYGVIPSIVLTIRKQWPFNFIQN